MKAQVIKLRPVMKNEKEMEEERRLIFELPRKNCEQIAPAVKRMELSGSSTKRSWLVLRRILRRARYKQLDEKVIPFLTDVDRSDHVVPNGEVSRQLYEDLFHNREFDLYANLRKETRHPPRKFQELQLLAEQMGITYTQRMDERFEGTKVDLDELAEEERQRRLRAQPKLFTEPWRIGKEEVSYGPVGLANNPSQPSNSLGNDPYYSYNGDWKSGQMHGRGKYLFEDGKAYEGEWMANRPHGDGKEEYLGNLAYEGGYSRGDYQGNGRAYCTDGKGVDYEGEFFAGYRHGHGQLTYPSGMTYIGDFLRGLPHGKGKMASKQTGWSYEGTFENGFILGSGVLISPQGERIVYYWADASKPKSLPSLVKHYLDAKDQERMLNDRKNMEMHAQLRGAQLREYVASIRNSLYQERVAEKRTKYNEAVQKVKEQKAKLYETRLKALVGEEDEDAVSEPRTAASSR